MKKIIALALLFMALIPTEGFGQRGNTDPVYFTDSDVKRRIVSFGVHYDPMFTQRRLSALDEVGLANDVSRDDFPATGGYGDNWGAYVNFNINSSLRLGIGGGQTNIRYRLDNFEYVEGADTSRLNLNVVGNYTTIPLRVGFTTSMNDVWDLEVWIPVAFNILNSYTESGTLNGVQRTWDLTDEARSNLWSAGILVGGAFYFTDNWAVTMSAQFRYFGVPMYDHASRPTETPYGLGGSVGLRYRL